MAAVAACSSSAAACAADPGDAPKQDGAVIYGGDASFEVGGDPPEAGFDAGGGPVDSSQPSFDVAVADVAGDVAPEVAGGDVVETGAVDAPPDVASCATCPLVVAYMTPTASATSQEIRPHLDVTNNGTSPQDLSALTLRYWYTADGSSSQAFACDYAALPSGCSQVAANFVQMPQPKTNADHYMEVSFSSGSIAPGGHTGEIQLRFHDTNYAVTFTQTNDYSFDASKAAYAPWDHVTLYRAGTLVWGTEPQ
jgi:cellulose 1,4-beta-cellobiosidase